MGFYLRPVEKQLSVTHAKLLLKRFPYLQPPLPHHSITCLSDFHRPADFLWACEAAQMQFASYIWVNYLHKFPMFSII